jgi:membrane associated rhomboid family serine protease
VSGFAGAVGVLVAPAGGVVTGAIGAIFGLYAAFGVVARRAGSSVTGLVILGGLILVTSLFLSSFALPNLIGGIVGGVVVALIYERTRLRAQRRLQAALVAGFAIVLVLISVVTYNTQVVSLAS